MNNKMSFIILIIYSSIIFTQSTVFHSSAIPSQNLEIPSYWSECSEVAGNVNNPLSGVNSGSVIGAFWNALIGMTLGQIKDFVIPVDQHPYTSGILAGQDLYYIVRIENIDSASGTTVTANSQVDVFYSLYIGCSIEKIPIAIQTDPGTKFNITEVFLKTETEYTIIYTNENVGESHSLVIGVPNAIYTNENASSASRLAILGPEHNETNQSGGLGKSWIYNYTTESNSWVMFFCPFIGHLPTEFGWFKIGNPEEKPVLPSTATTISSSTTPTIIISIDVSTTIKGETSTNNPQITTTTSSGILWTILILFSGILIKKQRKL
ncbi:MAG: hypothetical protein HeimC3_10900 [Candidatus Heimdallarchaeota archaeon LC_3]|nr:MAG: hypothetical protein HeimC3_10900 [Candidatus Heimdallarchaeota archaeon LC_3]